MTDRKVCYRSGTHTKENSTKGTDIQEIGDELVTYEEWTCKICGTPTERNVINRQKL